MTKRRKIRIDFELPELTPEQVSMLCDFLDDLCSDLREAYDNEIFDIESASFHALRSDDDSANEEPPSSPALPPPASPSDDESDF